MSSLAREISRPADFPLFRLRFEIFSCSSLMRVGFAQINTTVGDIRANRNRILSAYEKAVSLGAELVLTPELALTGYPPQDLVFKSRFVPETLEALEQLREAVDGVPLLVGYVDINPSKTGKPFAGYREG